MRPPIELARLHPTSLLFDIISHGRSYLIPAGIGLFSAARGNTAGVIVAGMIFFPSLLISIVRYFTFRYSIRNRQLIVTKGLLFRSVRTVPVSRIQNIDSVQNVLHRMLGVAEVRVETASGTEPEATLRVLSLEQLSRLRNEIFDLQEEKAEKTGDSSDHHAGADWTTPANVDRQVGAETAVNNFESISETVETNRLEKSGKTLLQIPVRWLVLAGLASNRGLILVGVVLGLLYQFDLDKNVDFKHLKKFVPQHADTITLVLLAIAGTIAFIVLLRLLGVGWYLLRFFDYRLIRRGDDLSLSCGLLTKVSATVPRRRIQFISIHRNLIMRYIGYSSIRIETAGGAGQDHEDATTTISRRWFVPIVPADQVPALLAELRPGLHWDESTLNFHPLSPQAGWRMTRLAVVFAILIGGISTVFVRPWGWIAGVAALPFCIAWAVKKSRSMHYARTEDGVVFRSGVLTRKTSMTFFERIQTFRVDQSPFDRRWKMAQLSIDTAASGPADHRIDVPFLDESFVFEELQHLKARTAQHQPKYR